MRRRPRTCPQRQLADASPPPSSTVLPVTPAPAPSFVADVASPPKPPPAPWWSPFGFLRDGTPTLSDGSSPALGRTGQPAVFRPRPPDAGLLRGLGSEKPPEKDVTDEERQVETTGQSTYERRAHRFPSWSSWKDWKKVTLDVYLRLTDRPIHTRLRLKQTIALLPVFKLKPVIDIAYRGPGVPPVSMHLDVKLLDCVKYRVRPDGKATLQVRAKAPLSDPRFCMDVIYERDLATALESVKISFRALDVAFLKAPGFGAGIKYPIRFANGVKSTLRVKKFLVDGRKIAMERGRGKQRRPLATKAKRDAELQNARFGAQGVQAQIARGAQRFGIEGPIGVDVKFRCLEYR